MMKIRLVLVLISVICIAACLPLSFFYGHKAAQDTSNNPYAFYMILCALLVFISGAVILKSMPKLIRGVRRLGNQTKVRVHIPSSTRRQVYARARGRCERPHCTYSRNLHIHHIDQDPSNNSPDNLLIVCPNCHSHIHHDEVSVNAQRSWIQYK